MNKIKKMPPSIGTLTKLQVLNVFNNVIGLSLPDEIVSIVLSFSGPPFALCVAPLVAKAWLAVSHLPALHKTLKIPVRCHT